jgi:hypothetical protein
MVFIDVRTCSAEKLIRVSCPHLQSSVKIVNPESTLKSSLDKGFMALRRILVSLILLFAFAGAAWLLQPHARPSTQTPSKPDGTGLPIQSFEFSYESESYLNPLLPGSESSQQGFSIACESKGFMHLGRSEVNAWSLLFEFTHVLCADADLMRERGLARALRYTRAYLASQEAAQRATEDPALAIARSLFLSMDMNLRKTWQGSMGDYQEQRLEGVVMPEISWTLDDNQVQWTRTFTGDLPGQKQADLVHTLRYQLAGRSEVTDPIEWGLVQLEGSEQSTSMYKKRLLARTDLKLRMQRVSRTFPDLPTLWAETPSNISAVAPQLFSAEEKSQLLQRWRQFRDGEGQQANRGSTQSNQDEYLELKQALRQDPTLADELAADLDAIDPTSSAFATLSGALIYSGETQALNAFVEKALAHKDDDAWQQRALPMIGLAPNPTGASWKYLDTMRQDSKEPSMKTAAELAMATHLKRGYQDPTFITEIQVRLQAARTETDRLHLLDVVGNSGLDQFLPIIHSWLQEASLPLRLRIAQSLRFMEDPKAETLLLEMAADQNPELAAMALQSLQQRQPSRDAIPVLLQVLTRSRDDRLRLMILENLYAARHQDAELLKKIQRIRSELTMGASLARAWDQLEKDWVDPVET